MDTHWLWYSSLFPLIYSVHTIFIESPFMGFVIEYTSIHTNIHYIHPMEYWMWNIYLYSHLFSYIPALLGIFLCIPIPMYPIYIYMPRKNNNNNNNKYSIKMIISNILIVIISSLINNNKQNILINGLYQSMGINVFIYSHRSFLIRIS